GFEGSGLRLAAADLTALRAPAGPAPPLPHPPVESIRSILRAPIRALRYRFTAGRDEPAGGGDGVGALGDVGRNERARRCGRRATTRRSAESAGDVVLGGLLRRRGEHRGGVVHLDELARLSGALDIEEARAVRDPRGLLHIVRD